MRSREYRTGVRQGIPIAMGYFSVSFGFGAMAAAQGIPAGKAALLSATNLTSAGQFAGLTLILARAGLLEVILTTLVINSRYALMSLAMSQRMGESMGLGARMLTAFFNTDEIFAVAMTRPEPLTCPYLLGLGTLPMIGWTGGTLLGAMAGSVLPLDLRMALGVMLYGMFIAIVVPPARRERPVLLVSSVALVLSCLFSWVPRLTQISPGIAILACTLIASGLGALCFPIEEEAA